MRAVQDHGRGVRILLDCSHINFASQPSGIPRVVGNYLTQGYRWSERTGIPLVPVVVREHGLVLARPMPHAAPGYPGEPHPAALDRLINFAAFLAYVAGHRFRHALRRMLHTADAAAQFEPGKNLFYRIDARLTSWAARLVAFARRIRPGQQLIEPRAGDILFCAGYWHETDPALYRKLAERGCEIVFLIHDILPVTLPHFYPYPWNALFKARLLEALDIASAILCVSAVTRDGVLDIAASTGTNRKVSVAYNGYQPLNHGRTSKSAPVNPQLESALGEDRAPFLMVSTIEPKKGQARIIDFFEKRWKAGYRRGLVLIGVPGWMSVDIVRKIRRSEYFGDLLCWFDNLDDANLDYAYRHCHALIVASIAEGFGLPMIEGAMARKPVLVNRSAIAEEILGDYPLYFEQSDASLSEALDRIEDPAIYRSRCERLEGFDWPDWRHTVPPVLDALAGSGSCWASLPRFIGPASTTPADEYPIGFCAPDVTDVGAPHTAR
jgi:glycosyltransferase involved in cell wall biosynthesis